ncbi:transposase family protein [Deinococcus sp. VB343]|uniref:transposase family protein n=1 Tax=unclassified Deinococcus TaxID=2623546 RepID=UPI0039C96CDC
MQLLIHATTHMIMCVTSGKGATHDLTLLRGSEVRVHPEVALIGDAGYQGIWRLHRYSLTPHKASKHHPLTSDERLENRAIASIRQPVEHVIRRLKIFRVLSCTLGIFRSGARSPTSVMLDSLLCHVLCHPGPDTFLLGLRPS